MFSTKKSKLADWFIFIMIVLLLIFLPYIYIYIFVGFNRNFWDNAISNWIATALAIIVGIPVSLWIDRRLKEREEKATHKLRLQREKDLLLLIKEELEYSQSLFVSGKKGNRQGMTIQPLKSDLWDALVSSDQMNYIKEPSLLNRITSAYYVLKIVKDIEKEAYNALRSSALVFTNKDGTQQSSAEKLIGDARNFDKLLEDSLIEALRMIEERVVELDG